MTKSNRLPLLTLVAGEASFLAREGKFTFEAARELSARHGLNAKEQAVVGQLMMIESGQENVHTLGSKGMRLAGFRGLAKKN